MRAYEIPFCLQKFASRVRAASLRNADARMRGGGGGGEEGEGEEGTAGSLFVSAIISS